MSWSTPQQLAERFGLETPAVLKFIASGELVAHDLAAPGARCHRWRIDEADLQAFLLRRRSQPAAQPRAKRKRQAAEMTGDFY